MHNNSSIRDLGLVILIIVGFIAACYLVVAGFMTLMIVSLITPAWLILLIVLLAVRKHKKRQSLK